MFDTHILIKTEGSLYVANPTTDSRELKPASHNDQMMAITQQANEFLESLHEAGFDDAEISELAPKYGVHVADVQTWAGQEKDGQITPWEAEVKTAISATMANAMLEHRGAVDIPAILQATEDEITAWADWYRSEAERIYSEMAEREKANGAKGVRNHDDTGWCLLLAQFMRQCELLWCCERRMGLC